MRINIEWIRPGLLGKPGKYWLLNTWTAEDNSHGFNIFGLYFSFSKTAKWRGVSFSINF